MPSSDGPTRLFSGDELRRTHSDHPCLDSPRTNPLTWALPLTSDQVPGTLSVPSNPRYLVRYHVARRD